MHHEELTNDGNYEEGNICESDVPPEIWAKMQEHRAQSKKPSDANLEVKMKKGNVATDLNRIRKARRNENTEERKSPGRVPMKVYYNPAMSVDSGGYSPSGGKPAAVVADWQAQGLAIEICDFEPVAEDDLCLAHDRQYIRNVLSGRLANGHGNTLAEVTQSCLWTCGSILAASQQALIDGITCSPTSGFHHAQYDRNGGFCTFNGLMVAAQKLRAEGLLTKVGILDCDAHYGNGTIDIMERLELQDHVKHWTFGGVYGPETFNQADLITRLGDALKMMKDGGAELILYQAGADPHEDDPLGGFQTTEEMRERDQFVFSMCRSLRLPVVFNLAGGYQRDSDGRIDAVLDLHRATMIEALLVQQTAVKKRSSIVDTTLENLGRSIAIIGGVRAPAAGESEEP